MNPLVYALAPAVLLATGWLTWWLRGRDNHRLFARATQVLQVELDQARAQATAEREKSARYLLKITDFENERDRIQELYSDHAIGHGNAQQLMMNTIENLARQLQQKGVKVRLPKVLEAVREEYQVKHEMPQRALADKTTPPAVSG